MNSLSIIIPAYNESSVIAEAIVAVETYAKTKKYDYEIIIVNDGSTDMTESVVIPFTNERVRLINNDRNRGKGYTVRHGIEVASKDWLLLCDADMSTPIGECNEFIQHTASFDIIIGSRRTIGSSITKHQPRWKELAGRLGNGVIRVVLALPYEDTQCGFKLFHKRIKPIAKRLVLNRWGFDFELLFAARQNKLRIKEVGVVWMNNADSKVKPIDYIKTLVDVFRVRFHGMMQRYKH